MSYEVLGRDFLNFLRQSYAGAAVARLWRIKPSFTERIKKITQ